MDDLILTGNDSELCEEFKDSIKREFEMTDLGKICYVLGVDQNKYVVEVLSRYGLEDCNHVNNLMLPGIKLSNEME